MSLTFSWEQMLAEADAAKFQSDASGRLSAMVRELCIYAQGLEDIIDHCWRCSDIYKRKQWPNEYDAGPRTHSEESRQKETGGCDMVCTRCGKTAQEHGLDCEKDIYPPGCGSYDGQRSITVDWACKKCGADTSGESMGGEPHECLANSRTQSEDT